MPDIVIHVLASAVYLGLAWHFWNTRWRRRTPATGLRPWERGAILVALGIHGALLYSQIFAAAELRFGFAQALSVMMWLAVLICWVEGIFYRIELVYPMALAAAALCAPLPAFFSGRASPDPVSFEFRLHLFFGMLAYSLFVVATFHALLISSVERRLH
ncbi:MAG: cytochrome C biogenesis protein, partial [Betaproteobacteria bacterium]